MAKKVKKKKKVVKKKDGRGGKRKGAGRKKGEPHSLINFRILTEKKIKFKKKVKKPNEAFNQWVDQKISESDLTDTNSDGPPVFSEK